MDKIDVFVSLAFRVSPENGGVIPFSDFITNPNKIIPKRDDNWEILGKLHPDGIPFQSFKFRNNVIISIQPDFAEIRQDAIQNQDVTFANIIQIAEQFSNIAIKYNINHTGLNYSFIIPKENPNDVLNNKLHFSINEKPTETSYTLVYEDKIKQESTTISINSGGVTFPTSAEIKGIIFNANYDRKINDATRMRSTLDFVTNIDNIFDKIKEKSNMIAKDYDA